MSGTILARAGHRQTEPTLERSLVDVPATSDELTARCADTGVLVRNGREYGPSGEGQVRLSFPTDDEILDEGLRRLTACSRP